MNIKREREGQGECHKRGHGKACTSHDSGAADDEKGSLNLPISKQIQLRMGLQRHLLKALLATSGVMLCELVGGVLSGSLGLLGDAFHMMTDSLGLLAAFGIGGWILKVLKKRLSQVGSDDEYLSPTTRERMFRVESKVALLQALWICLLGLFLIYESYERYHRHEFVKIHVEAALSIGLIGLIGNLITLRLLHSDEFQTSNAKAAYLHVLSDLVSSIAVLVSLVIVKWTGMLWVDLVCAFFAGVWIFVQAARLAREQYRHLV